MTDLVFVVVFGVLAGIYAIYWADARRRKTRSPSTGQ
jgi:hypothetical protein